MMDLMEKKPKTAGTVAIIGARGGSKAVPGKNVADVGGYPLIAYSIAVAKLTPGIDRVIVSTDSSAIADVAKPYGVEVPFLRPAHLAGDHSTDREFIVHALEWIRKEEGAVPEFVVLLRPTSPLRDPKVVARALEMIKADPEATGLRSAHATSTVPHKMFGLEGRFLRGLFPHDTRTEYHGLPRQAFPLSYKADGYVDILRSSTVLGHPERTFGEHILAFITPDTGDIDHQGDLEHVLSILAADHWDVYEYLKKHFPPRA
jgi:CMP-N,N'-diacetyllegionaminic acid synthase